MSDKSFKLQAWSEEEMYFLADLLLSDDGMFRNHVREMRENRTPAEAARDQEDLCEDVAWALTEFGLLDAYRQKKVAPFRFVCLAANPEALEYTRSRVEEH